MQQPLSFVNPSPSAKVGKIQHKNSTHFVLTLRKEDKERLEAEARKAGQTVSRYVRTKLGYQKPGARYYPASSYPGRRKADPLVARAQKLERELEALWKEMDARKEALKSDAA